MNVSQLVNLILFADDTNMFISDNDLTSLIVKVDDELSKLFLWFRVNRLLLNVKKTNLILFRTKNKRITENVKIHIDGVDISRVTTIKFLGVIINETLTWDDHMKLIYNKISKSNGIIQRVSYNLPTFILLSLYYTIVHPYFEYCNIIWANVKSKYLDKLSTSQRKVLHIVLKWNALIDHLC